MQFEGLERRKGTTKLYIKKKSFVRYEKKREGGGGM